jgi:hypothetical protein
MGVHDLSKYPEIKELLEIPEDEPIFIIRAQDMTSTEALATYSRTARMVGADEHFLRGMADIMMDFADWRIANQDKIKVPDSPTREGLDVLQ